jgi:hypothetical protein
MSALVPLAVARQCFAPVSDAYADSKAATLSPRFHLPLRITRTSASSSFASATGHDGNGVRRTGVPPRSAGALDATAVEAACAGRRTAACVDRLAEGARRDDGSNESTATHASVDFVSPRLVRADAHHRPPINW